MSATFPPEAVMILNLLKGDAQSDQRPRELSIYVMVDMLGWSQTYVADAVRQLVKAGWLDERVAPDGNPAGGAAPVYQLKKGVMDRVPDLPEGTVRPWAQARSAR